MPSGGAKILADRVRFWEEQDKINQALIPRVLELHEAVKESTSRCESLSGEVARAEARCVERINKVEGAARLSKTAYWLSIVAAVLSIAALVISIFSLYRA